MRREKGNSRRSLNPFSRRFTRRREKPLFPTPLPTHCSRCREKGFFPTYSFDAFVVRRERWFSRRSSRRVVEGVGKALIPDVLYADVIFGVGNAPFSCSGNFFATKQKCVARKLSW
uniref:Uncharacterized protein n=1 Tax=Cucumis melo TaxID=3656 RepID=A0A9I9E478_CUCME